VAGSRVAERAAAGGEHDVVDARAQALRSSGRHWKIAECSLSIGSSVAPPSAAAPPA
jgi:hypothetical protein